MKRSFLLIVFISFWIFFVSWFIPHKTGLNGLNIQSEDTLPAMFIPVAIIKEKTIFLDSYYNMLLEKYPHPDDKKQEMGLTPYYLRKVLIKSCLTPQQQNCVEQAHYVSAFPIITPLIALPIYFLPVFLGLAITWENITILAVISSSIIMALAGGFMYFTLVQCFFPEDLEKRLLQQKYFLLTLIYLFGSINYAHISQALWQHGTVQLFTILAVLALYKKRYFLMGLCFGLMLISRPTSGVAVVLLCILALKNWLSKKQVFFKNEGSLSILITRLKSLIPWVAKVFLGILIPLLFFLWYNNKYYGSISNQGYSNQVFTEWKGRFPEGFLGLWISPSKGILIYSPIFVFSIFGIYLTLKNVFRSDSSFYKDFLIFGLIVFLHTLILGFWKHWYGGWSFGYRMASDILPFLVFLLIPFVKSSYFSKYQKAFYLLFLVSLSWELMGLVFYDGIWHAAYDRGFVNTNWLWSCKDSELAFNLRRILVKLGFRVSPF